jgi:hypothetical protein
LKSIQDQDSLITPFEYAKGFSEETSLYLTQAAFSKKHGKIIYAKTHTHSIYLTLHIANLL